MNQETDRLIPVAKWEQYHPWPSTSGLRNLIFKANHNGLDPAIFRVGRRILISERAFFAWVNRQGSNS